ncbi:MAG: hypothetical protein HOF58_04430 [Candidatus Marinimicrobia bacterium]|nr:hypothetical protein [Candidatus Neomarinimicrobiota bacterium]
MRKLIILPLFVGYLFGLHGKITFFDGTYVVGRVTKVDESTVYIIPMGLDTAEGILVGNIDTLKMENGMLPVVNSAVKYFYEKGEFLANNDDWMDEFDDFQYDDYTTLEEEYKYEETKKPATAYNSVTVYGGMPFPMASLNDSAKTTTLAPNLGIGIQAPYFPVGAVDISPGLKIMTFGFDNPDMGIVNAIQLGGNMSVDFKPVFFFLPEALHLCMDLGINYNIAFKHEPSAFALSHGEYDGEPTYGGIGFNTGASMDYWFSDIPLALRLFGNTNIIPQGEPYPELKTGFINVGAMLIVVMKRHR